jgi:hypothetical protein
MLDDNIRSIQEVTFRDSTSSKELPTSRRIVLKDTPLSEVVTSIEALFRPPAISELITRPVEKQLKDLGHSVNEMPLGASISPHDVRRYAQEGEFPLRQSPNPCGYFHKYIPDPSTIGLVGVNRHNGYLKFERAFIANAGHIYSLFLVNIRATVERKVLFRPRAFWEDLSFADDCHEAGLHVIKYNRFVHRKLNFQPLNRRPTLHTPEKVRVPFIWERSKIIMDLCNSDLALIQQKISDYFIQSDLSPRDNARFELFRILCDPDKTSQNLLLNDKICSLKCSSDGNLVTREFNRKNVSEKDMIATIERMRTSSLNGSEFSQFHFIFFLESDQLLSNIIHVFQNPSANHRFGEGFYRDDVFQFNSNQLDTSNRQWAVRLIANEVKKVDESPHSLKVTRATILVFDQNYILETFNTHFEAALSYIVKSIFRRYSKILPEHQGFI